MVLAEEKTMIHPDPTLRPIRPFPLRQVRLLAGPFRDAFELNRAYLHSLEPERLLHTFRETAGLPSDAEPLGGWEAPDSELRGHCAGHYLSGCALTFAATGDEELLGKAGRVVDGFAECQKSLRSSMKSRMP